MGVFDLSLDELKTYTGSSPKPPDFDRYWIRALSSLDSIPLKYSINPASDAPPCDFAKCMDLCFVGIGNAVIYAKLLIPNRHDPGPALAVFHGYGDNEGDWFDKMPYAAQGITVAAMSCRGQGGRSQDTCSVVGSTYMGHIIRGATDPDPDKLYYRQVFLDTVQLIKILRSLDCVDPTRVGVTGISQGGGLALACAALTPDIARVGVWYPFLCDYKRVCNMDMSKDAYAELSYYFRICDPMHLNEASLFERLGYIDVVNHAQNIHCKTLFLTGLMDTVCPPSTQFAAYNRITSEKRMILFPEYCHEQLKQGKDIIYQYFCEM